MTIELGNTTLTHLTHIAVDEHARIAYHPVPGMQGDLAQTLGRDSVVVRFQGIFYGPDAATDLGNLRAAYLQEEPVDFFAEAIGQGYFSQVLIARLEVSQKAGYLDQYDYLCEVVEYVEPPEPALTETDLLGALDNDLLEEATAFVDDVQDAIKEVSGLANLIANFPSFGDPTTRLGGMLDQYKELTGSGTSTLGDVLGSLSSS